MSRLKRLISEIHHRSLWQVLLIYVGAGWACFELIDAVTNRLGLPAWLPGLAIVLFLLALPVVVATAFIQDREPATPVSDPTLIPVDDVRTDETRRRQFLTWRNAGLSFLVALAVWGVVATGSGFSLHPSGLAIQNREGRSSWRRRNLGRILCENRKW